jgi:hypothetical protein
VVQILLAGFQVTILKRTPISRVHATTILSDVAAEDALLVRRYDVGLGFIGNYEWIGLPPRRRLP